MPPRVPNLRVLAVNPAGKRVCRPFVPTELNPSIPLTAHARNAAYDPRYFSDKHRAFSVTPLLQKKKDKAVKSSSSSSSPSEAASAEDSDPFDFTALQQGIDKSLEKLKNDLSKLRTGGRFNPEVLEALRVKLSKDSKESFRLGDLAQVLPKGGRSVQLLVGEQDHVKPITSAIQAAPNLQLTPQTDAHNPLALNIPIPPPTKESRDAAGQAASKAGEQAYVGVRNARAASQKRLRAMELKKLVRPDDLKKAHKEMESVVEKGNKSVKEAVDAAKKAMEQ
ncbi:Ribosome recycling factor protein [Rutstroemia sp. NJR-2017a WRK4]|nr:Ribosome recycling factor protein [Rutstroemia sp. NJR-2017a WRK4]